MPPETEEKPAERLAFARLILPHQAALYARALGLERCAHDASDLVQDTIERAIRNFDHFQAGTNLRGWLFRIMYNLFVDRCRRRTNDPGHEPLEGHDVAADDSPTPAAWEAYEPAQVTEALERLDPPFRMVLELHFGQRRSYRDISARLGIPTGTVGTRLLRARKKLRRILEPAAPPPS